MRYKIYLYPSVPRCSRVLAESILAGFRVDGTGTPGCALDGGSIYQPHNLDICAIYSDPTVLHHTSIALPQLCRSAHRSVSPTVHGSGYSAQRARSPRRSSARATGEPKRKLARWSCGRSNGVFLEKFEEQLKISIVYFGCAFCVKEHLDIVPRTVPQNPTLDLLGDSKLDVPKSLGGLWCSTSDFGDFRPFNLTFFASLRILRNIHCINEADWFNEGFPMEWSLPMTSLG